MNVVIRRRDALPKLIALLGVIVLLLTTLPAQAAPPVDEIEFSGERCASGRPTVDVSATGKGRWGVMIVEVSTDGGETWQDAVGSLLRFEHGTEQTVAWSESVTFRATDAKNNGDTIGTYVYSDPISCPLS